jgi:hypothetical protein
MVVDIESGTPGDNNVITGATSGATAAVNGAVTSETAAGVGVILGVNDGGTTGTMYIQLTKGVVPVDNDVIYKHDTHTQYAVVNGSVTTRTIKPVFVGSTTGSAIIGAYGIGFDSADTTASDQFTDLSGSTVTPPNNVTFTVAGLVSGDRVLVTNYDGSTTDSNGDPTPDYGQFATSGTLNGASVTSVVISGAIPADTPSSGVIRVVNDEGYHIRLPYSSWATSTFTLTSAYNFSGSGVNDSVTSGNDCYLAYIDTAASGSTVTFTTVYNADRDLVIRVRDGGATPIKPFTTTGTLASAGGSTTAIRTGDA